MKRILVGEGVGMITEIRREASFVPGRPARRRVAAMVAALLALGLVNVWLSGQYYRVGYGVSDALEEVQNLRKERELLRTEILTLGSPARIETIAKSQLGMVDPKNERIIRIR